MNKLFSLVALAVVSMLSKEEDHPDVIDTKAIVFSTTGSYNNATVAIVVILTAFYVTWW